MTDVPVKKKNSEAHTSDIALCVCCGAETEYSKDTPIDECVGYIEGAGQLCRKCYLELYGKSRQYN